VFNGGRIGWEGGRGPRGPSTAEPAEVVREPETVEAWPG
jgi:hypothetical protein